MSCVTKKQKAPGSGALSGGTGNETKAERSQYTRNYPPLSSVPQKRPCVHLEFCCPKHSDMGSLELKRTYRIKRHCEIHTTVHASAEAVMEKLGRLKFEFKPTGMLNGMAFRLLDEGGDHE